MKKLIGIFLICFLLFGCVDKSTIDQNLIDGNSIKSDFNGDLELDLNQSVKNCCEDGSCSVGCKNTFDNKGILDSNKIFLTFNEIVSFLPEYNLKEEYYSIMTATKETSPILGINNGSILILPLNGTNILDQIMVSVFVFDDITFSEQYYKSYSSEESVIVFESSQLKKENLTFGNEGIIYYYSDIAGSDEIFDSLYHQKLFLRKENIVISLEMTSREQIKETTDLKGFVEKLIQNVDLIKLN